MNKIKFSHNWNNKLNNAVFTTIRKYNEEKYQYYCNALGTEFEIILTSINPATFLFATKLMSVEKITFKDIPLGLIEVDTGLRSVEANKLFRRFGIEQYTEVLILTFERTS